MPWLTAFGGWLKGVPQWVWMAAAAAMGIFIIRRDAYNDGHEDGERKVIDQIEESTDEALERVEVEDERTRDLNDAERMRLARESPNNRRRM